MRISFNQPAFIPWGGFFARLMSSDAMVLLDDTVLARGFTYVNRNRIKGPEGEVWLTVPLKRKGLGAQKIKDLKIYEKQRWAKKFLLTLKHYYGKSAVFEPIFQQVRGGVESSDDRFMSLVSFLLNIIRTGFRIEKDMILQSSTGIIGKGTPLLIALAKKLGAREVLLPYGAEKAVKDADFRREDINVRFLRYLPPQYPQFWGDFVMNLSALDLLLCLGESGRSVIERGIRLDHR